MGDSGSDSFDEIPPEGSPDTGEAQTGSLLVVSWNVLSKAFVSKKAYPQMSPQAVDNACRWKLVKSRLEAFMSSRAVVLLQEVDQDWAARVLALAHKAGYYAHQTRYGSPRSNYMSLIMMLPLAAGGIRLVCGPVETRVGDEVRKLAPAFLARDPPASSAQRACEWVCARVDTLAAKFGGGGLRAYFFGPELAFDAATRAWNFAQMATLLVTTAQGERPVKIVNYHNPCYITPDAGGFNIGLDVRELHLSALVAWAGNERCGKTPLVVGIDTNMRPPELRRVLERNAPARECDLLHSRAWKRRLCESIHMAATTSTISARTPEGFVGALDQILVDSSLGHRRPTAQEKLSLGFGDLHDSLEDDAACCPRAERTVSKNSLSAFWPNEQQPSDHLPVATVVGFE